LEVDVWIHEAIFHEYAYTHGRSESSFPEDAKSVCKGTLKHNATVPILEDFDAWPMQQPVQAGLYLLSIEASPPFTNKDAILSLKPPAKHTEINLKA
jgi:hypothetical protein